MKEQSLYQSTLPKPLDNNELNKYFSLANNGDEQAKKILIECNYRLVLHTVNTNFLSIIHTYPKIEIEDLISIGSIGLIKAVETFNADKNIIFYTYATKCVKNEILMYLRKEKKEIPTISLNSPITIDLDNNQLYLQDIIETDEMLEDEYIETEFQNKVRESLSILTPLERKVVEYYYGFNKEPLNFTKISKILGFSKSYIRNIELKARIKLTKHLINKGLGTEKKYSKEIRELKLKSSLEIALYFTNKIINTGTTIEELSNNSDYSIVSIKRRLLAVMPKLDEELKTKLQVALDNKPKGKKDNTDFFDFTEYKSELKELINLLEDKLEQTILLLRLGFMDNRVYSEDEIAFFLEMDVKDIHKTIDSCLRKLLTLSKEPFKTEEYIQQKLTLTKEN